MTDVDDTPVYPLDENPDKWLGDPRIRGRWHPESRIIVSRLLGRDMFCVNRKTLEARLQIAHYDASDLARGFDGAAAMRCEIAHRLESLIGSEYAIDIKPPVGYPHSFVMICTLERK